MICAIAGIKRNLTFMEVEDQCLVNEVTIAICCKIFLEMRDQNLKGQLSNFHIF